MSESSKAEDNTLQIVEKFLLSNLVKLIVGVLAILGGLAGAILQKASTAILVLSLSLTFLGLVFLLNLLRSHRKLSDLKLAHHSEVAALQLEIRRLQERLDPLHDGAILKILAYLATRNVATSVSGMIHALNLSEDLVRVRLSDANSKALVTYMGPDQYKISTEGRRVLLLKKEVETAVKSDPAPVPPKLQGP